MADAPIAFEVWQVHDNTAGQRSTSGQRPPVSQDGQPCLSHTGGAVQLPSCFILNAGGPCTTWPLVHGGFALDGRCSIFSHAISSAPPRWMPRPRPTALFPTGLGAGFDPLDRHALHQNPAEKLRRCPCDSWLSNRMFASYQDTLEECCQSGVARLVENW